MTETISTAPNGEQFSLPTSQDEAAEIQRLQTLVAQFHGNSGDMTQLREQLGSCLPNSREIVVVMGVGFVGAVMAGVVADSVDKKTGLPNKFVIGMQRPSIRSFWKIPLLNRGIAPVESEDPRPHLPFGDFECG